MGVHRPVVQVLRSAVLHAAHQPSVGHTVAGQLVGDQNPRHVLQSREQLAEKPGRGRGVTSGGNQDVQHIPVLVNRPPQIVSLPVDLDEYLVKVPRIPRAGPMTAQPLV